MLENHFLESTDIHGKLRYAFSRSGGHHDAESGDILLLHGVTRRHADWWPIVPALGASKRLWGLDFRGHGASDPQPNAYKVADYVDDAVAMLRHIATPLRPVIVIGHSLGAMIAALAAAREPQLVRALVLEDPPFSTLGPEILNTAFHAQFCGIRELLPTSLDRKNPTPERISALARTLGEITLPRPEGASVQLKQLRDAAALRFMARCLIDMDPTVLDPLIQGVWMDGIDLPATAAACVQPVLLLAADLNCGGMLKPSDADLFVRYAPDCHRVDLPGISHQIHSTQTELFLRLVWPFLLSV